jgi:hypothetical protein
VVTNFDPDFDSYNIIFSLIGCVLGSKNEEVKLFPALKYANLKSKASETFRNFRNEY